jgi:hypothetical protein
MRQTVEVWVAELQGFCDEMTEKKHKTNSRGGARRRVRIGERPAQQRDPGRQPEALEEF